MSKNAGGWAFPCHEEVWGAEGYYPVLHQGMSLRDYFAAAALNGLVSSSSRSNSLDAKIAYALADAMLAERSKTEPES